MKVEKNNVISVAYQLYNKTTNELVEEVNDENPLTFIYGEGNLLPKFEENLQSLTSGDKFDFILNHTEAYGEIHENAIVELSKKLFEVEGVVRDDLLKIGNVIPMSDNQGRRMDGRVIGLTDEAVKMDFNHPMAGIDLNFKGSIVSVRTATEEELANGLYGPSCGCGEGGCESEDCDSDASSCGC